SNLLYAMLQSCCVDVHGGTGPSSTAFLLLTEEKAGLQDPARGRYWLHTRLQERQSSSFSTTGLYVALLGHKDTCRFPWREHFALPERARQEFTLTQTEYRRMSIL